MALFRWKKKKDEPDASDQGGGVGDDSHDGAAGSAEDYKTQLEKERNARKWFEHARSMADRFDYAYALHCYASGIKLDPETMSAHEEMLETAIKYMNKGGKPATSKEIRAIADGSAMSKFAAAEFAWMKDYRNASLALKALDAAVKAEQFEFGNWIAPRVLSLLRSQKKPSKSTLSTAKDLFAKVGAWDEAIAAGEFLLQMDPRNNELAAELKDLAAQRAMDQGGYERGAGQEGGFRHFVKDADRQRELIESESIAAGESVDERNLQRARQAYQENPTAPDVIAQYAKLLKIRGTPEAIKEAFDIYMTGYKDTGEYRFRMFAGDIKIEQLRAKVRVLKESLEQSPDDEDTKKQLKAAKAELLEMQSKEYAERVRKYPTDRYQKFDLGRVEYELGNYESAMAQFQATKDEPKLRVRSAHMLGRCFASEGWHLEAIAEFKEALNAIDAGDRDRELEIRYDLMASLIEQARLDSSLDIAREALEICSGIARRNITYRDIRRKRKEIDTLLKELSSSGSSGDND